MDQGQHNHRYGREHEMSTERLTRILAERVMGWRIAPGRFLKSGRTWLPSWRFQPITRLDHALELLNKATDNYAITSGKNGITRVVVHIGNRSGTAEDRSKPRAITHAVARALGIRVNEPCRGGDRDGTLRGSR
jgi:hypothetical protein